MASPSVFHVALAGTGLVFIWSGLHGARISVSIKELLAGHPLQAPDEPLIRSLPATSGGADAGSVPDPGTTPAPAGGNRANGQLQAAGYGWVGAQWTALDKLWTRESNWSNTAQNPTSTAYGIAQFLDGTWAGYGAKTSDATLQIRYGLKYIKNRYGDPVHAWAHETSAGWY